MKFSKFISFTFITLIVVIGISACRKTNNIGDKPIINLVEGTDYITGDSTLIKDKKYMFKVNVKNAEDQTLNSYFEVSRTYSSSSDTVVHYQDLKDTAQKNFNYIHTFTTLKQTGTERFTITVKNQRGIVGQKILVFTVK